MGFLGMFVTYSVKAGQNKTRKEVDNMRKRLLAILLTICMIVSLAPTVLADAAVTIVLPDQMQAWPEEKADFTVTDGTNYYATLKDALAGIHLTENRVLYCKPGAVVGEMTHGHVCANLTVYGNGAKLAASGEQDFEIGMYNYCHNGANTCNGITSDLTLNVISLDGCGAWGNRATNHTVNLEFENCQDMNRVYINGTGGENNISLTNCSFRGLVENRCTLYSNANGAITLSDVEFSNIKEPVNLNHKVAGTQTIAISNCTFNKCGTDENDYAAPIRVLSSVEGASSVLTVYNCTFTQTVPNKLGQNADILLDYGIGTTTASVSGTTANVVVEKENNVGTPTAVTSSDNLTFKNFDPVAKIGDAEYASLSAAMNDAANNDTVTVLTDIVLTEALTIPAGKTVTLDLNGKTVSYETTESKADDMIVNRGNLTITDSSAEKNGKLSYVYTGTPNTSYSYDNATIQNEGVLTIEAGTVENTTAAMSHASYAINTNAGATLNISGGKVLNLNGHAIRQVSFGTEANTVNISGGYIEGTRAVQLQLPGSASATTAPEMTLNITGGELKSNEETYNLAVYIYSNGQSAANASISVSNDAVINGNIALNATATNSMTAGAASVTGGTINGDYGIFSYADVDTKNVITISGGTFATDYSEMYAENDGYTFRQNKNGSYNVTIPKQEITPVISIDGWTYGETAKTPTVSGNLGNGDVTYEYKLKDAADATYTPTVPTNAGVYTVKAVVSATEGYYDGEATADFTIAKKEVTAPAADTTSYIYDGQAKIYQLASNSDYTISGNTQTNAGSYTVTVALKNKNNTVWADTDDTADKTYTFNIAKRSVRLISADDSKVYDGTALTNNTVTVSGDGFADGEGATYTFTGTQTDVGSSENTFNYTLNENTNADNYTIAMGNGTLTVSIAALDFDASIDGWTYGENPNVPTVSGNIGDVDVTLTYSVKGENNFTSTVPTDAGEYTLKVTVPATANLTGGEKTVDFTIAKKEVVLNWSELTASDLVYSGTAKTLTAAADDLVTGDSCNVTVQPVGDNVNVGTFSYKAVSLSNSNYKLPSDVNSPDYTITAKTVNNPTIVLSQNSYVYDGTAKEPAVEVKDGSTVIPASEYTVSYSNNVNQGTATVTITDKEGGNYTVSGSATFTISQSDTIFADSVKADKSEYTYGERITVTAKPVVTGTSPAAAYSLESSDAGKMALYAGDKQISDAVSADENGVYTMIYETANKDLVIGSNTITARFIGNANMADAEQNVVIKLNPKQITAADASAEDRTYDQTNVVEITSVSLNGVIDGDDVSVNTNGLTGTISSPDAGEYSEITLTALRLNGRHRSYYTLELPAVVEMTEAVTISEKSITATVILSQTSYNYDGTPKEPAVTVIDGNIAVPADEYTVSYSNNVNQGTATVTITDSTGGNYNVTGSASFSIMNSGNAEIQMRTVSFDANGGSYTPASQTVSDGSLISEPADPYREDYEFIGWATDREGNSYWNFKADTLTEDITLYAQWQRDKFDVSGEVHTHDGKVPGHEVQVIVKQGSQILAEVMTNTDGHYDLHHVPAGIYNIVAIENDGRTMTAKAEVYSDVTVDEIRLPENNVSSELEIPADGKTPNIVVGGLAEEAEEHAVEDAGTEQPHVTISMGIELKDDITEDSTADEPEIKTSQMAIKEQAIQDDSETDDSAADKRQFTFHEITLEKSTEGIHETEEITETKNLLEIIVPFITNGKTSFRVYRYHENAVHELTPAPNSDGEYIEIGEEHITIHAKFFSTYAISYVEETEAPQQPESVVSSVAISDVSVNAQPGMSVQFTAAVDGSNLSDTSVIWNVYGNTDAETTIDSDSGLLTIGKHETASTLTVTAQSVQDPSKIATKIINLNYIKNSFDSDRFHLAVMMLYNQEYSIYASASEGGTITPAGTSTVKFEKNITYTITPDEGYAISAVLVDGKDIGSVSEYTFKRVKETHNITVVFEEIE